MGRHRLATVSIAYVLLAASVAGTPLALGPGTAAANHQGPNYAVGQGGQCIASIHPLGDGSQTAEAYYGLEDFGSQGTTELQQTYLSQFYVYEASDGTALVILHDEYGDGTGGGAVTFNVTGLPGDGDWEVEDDDYSGRDDNFDHHGSWSEIDWMYGYNKTDGGVFVGLDGDGWSEITIEPAFKEESYGAEIGWNLSDEGPDEWRARGASGLTDELDMGEPVSIREGDCAAVSPETALSGPDQTTTEATVTLDASNPESPTSPIEYAWDFQGDGSVDVTTTSPTVEHQFDQTGETAASVTVTDRFGNTDTATKTISVVNDTPPTAVADVPGSIGTGESFTADGSGSSDETSIVSYEWDFDDGTTASGETATHAYEETGNYTVALTVTDDAGKTDTDSATVEVTDGTPPAAELSAPGEVEKNESFTLDASGSSDDGDISEYRWDLNGDGSTDETTNDAALDHSYADEGDHEVTVTVVDEAGNEGTDSATVHVIDETPPSASLTLPESATAGSGVTLDASGSTDNVGIDHYEWTFGDGADGETTADAATAHTYETAGNYTATVTAVDVDGNTDTANATITIEPAPEGNDSAPTASISADVTEVPVGQPVQFDGSASNDPDGDVVNYAWDFDDGTEGAGNTTEHTYDAAGNYTVTLTVTDDAGGSDTASVTITAIDEDPAATFTVEPDPPVVGQEVTFDASETTDDTSVDSYEWDFDDGNATTTDASEPTATHTYAQSGERTVTLNVTDEAGNVGTATRTFTVQAEERGGNSGNSGGNTGSSGGGGGGAGSGSGGGSGGGGSGGGGGGGGAPTTDEPEPDLTVTSVSANRSSVLAGQVVAVDATVENRGGAAGSERFGPALVRRPVELQEVTLEPGESRNLTFAVTLEEPGEQTISVGDRETTVTVGSPEPDTAIASVELEDRTVDVGEAATIVATVRNQGGTAGEHAVSLSVFGEVVDRKVVSVPPGETRTVQFTQRFAESGTFTLHVGDLSETVTVDGQEARRTETFDASDTGGPTPGLGLVVGGGLTLVVAAVLVSSRL